MTMEMAIFYASCIFGFCLALWTILHYADRSRHYDLSSRGLAIEEGKFELHRSAIERQRNKELFPNSKTRQARDPRGPFGERCKVVPFPGKGPPPHVIADLADALDKAKDMPEEEAAAYLAERGFPMVPAEEIDGVTPDDQAS